MSAQLRLRQNQKAREDFLFGWRRRSGPPTTGKREDEDGKEGEEEEQEEEKKEGPSGVTAEGECNTAPIGIFELKTSYILSSCIPCQCQPGNLWSARQVFH